MTIKPTVTMVTTRTRPTPPAEPYIMYNVEELSGAETERIGGRGGGVNTQIVMKITSVQDYYEQKRIFIYLK